MLSVEYSILGAYRMKIIRLMGLARPSIRVRSSDVATRTRTVISSVASAAEMATVDCTYCFGISGPSPWTTEGSALVRDTAR